MARRRSEDERVVAIVLGFGMILVLLAVANGVLPWAIAVGVAAAAGAYWLTEEWKTAGIAGVTTAGAILLIGDAAVLSPG